MSNNFATFSVIAVSFGIMILPDLKHAMDRYINDMETERQQKIYNVSKMYKDNAHIYAEIEELKRQNKELHDKVEALNLKLVERILHKQD